LFVIFTNRITNLPPKAYKSKVIPATNNHVVYFQNILDNRILEDTLDPPRTAGNGFHYFSKLCLSFISFANNNQNIFPLGKTVR
jgi:hypothetical protein